MRLEFLATSEDGLRWMLRYYDRVFPEGRAKGRMRYREAKRLLRDNPLSGHQFEEWENIRELKIPRTPFSILYTLGTEVIYVIDIRDQRGVRATAGIERFRKKR